MSYPPRSATGLAAGPIMIAAYIGFFGFVLGVFFIVFALGDLRLSLIEPKLAEVTEKTVQRQLIPNKTGEMKTVLVNWIELQLTNDAGQVIRFGLTPRDATYAQLITGQRVLVRFNRSNPLSSVLDSEFRAGGLRFDSRSFGRFAVLAVISSVFLAAWARAKAQRLIGVRDRGYEKNAVVIAHETSFWRGGKSTIAMSAVWRDETGRLGRSFWAQVRPGAPVEHLPPVGESIRVYVDAVAPDLSVWEGDVGTRPDAGESGTR